MKRSMLGPGRARIDEVIDPHRQNTVSVGADVTYAFEASPERGIYKGLSYAPIYCFRTKEGDKPPCATSPESR